jgi:signal transduction histidine kinase
VPETATHVVRFDPLVGMYLRLTGRPLAVDELAAPGVADARLAAGLADLLACGAALVLPLFVDGELTGVLVVGGKATGEVFHPAEVELLEMLAGQAAVALKNSRLYSDLRAQMDELTRTQQQLVQAAKLAAIGELAAGVAHEINNPLTTILGNCELALRRVSADSELHRRLRTLQEEGRRAARITRALLDFARRREPARQPVEIARLVTRTVELLATRVGRKAIAIDTHLDPRTPPILGDADQLTQVLLNLAGNAMDAMPGGGALTIRTEWHQGLDVVTVALTDTGIGMSAEQRARIFEPFYTTKPEGQGTGLGLSLSLGIVKSHGGNLTVESEPGQGTTMTVSLPARSVSAPAQERITPAS